MKRIWRSALIVFLVLLSFLVVGIDKNISSGDYTVRSGETSTAACSFVARWWSEEGATVDGSVFMGSGVLYVNGKVTGGIFSLSGENHTGPNAVVNGHAHVTSVPFEPNRSTRFIKNVIADVAGWLGGPLGAAVVLLALTFYLVFGPVIGRYIFQRGWTVAPDESESAYRSAALYSFAVVLVAVGAVYASAFLGLTIDQFAFSVALLVSGLVLFAVMLTQGRQESVLAVFATALLMAGAIELYQGVTGYWQSWAFAWALVVPMYRSRPDDRGPVGRVRANDDFRNAGCCGRRVAFRRQRVVFELVVAARNSLLILGVLPLFGAMPYS